MTKKLTSIICILLLLSSNVAGQKVGLVLSGGGAKGYAHIGVIKALEENEIPIDYISGTSMGAIVGGLYSIGYTPDEMIQFFKSEDFHHWSTGKADTKHQYNRLSAETKPGVAEIYFSTHKRDSVKASPNLLFADILPTNIVSPKQMEFGFFSLFANANASIAGDFNNLFVPFRCVASDIYKKEAVVLKSGLLYDAIRASMTFPFVFKPISIDNRLLFDGGIYDNFPVKVMRDEFNPDFMIGSNVSRNPTKPEANNIIEQVKNMIMSQTDYSIPREEGITFDFNIPEEETFNFEILDQLVELGYSTTLRQIDSIKLRVKSRRTESELKQKRALFRNKLPELIFSDIKVKGVDENQQKFIVNLARGKNEKMNINDFKLGYNRLVSDERIQEVKPEAEYNPQNGNFNLTLDVKTQDKLKLTLGGNVSTSTSNQTYLGLTHQNIGKLAQTSTFETQLGSAYNGFAFDTYISSISTANWYLRLNFNIHKFDYFKKNDLFFINKQIPNFSQRETYLKLAIGKPISMRGHIEFGIGFANLSDKYPAIDISDEDIIVTDRNRYLLGKAFARTESYTFNHKLYPTKGRHFASTLQMVGGMAQYARGGNTHKFNSSDKDKNDLWFQYRGSYDYYFTLNKHFVLGTSADIAISTRKLLQNYTATIIQAPTFAPTPHSKVKFNEAFSANQFAAIGIKPIYILNNQMHLRTEAYCFAPYRYIIDDTQQRPYYSKALVNPRFMAESSLVFDLKVASIAAFANFYSHPTNNWNFGINIGYLLFNKRFIE